MFASAENRESSGCETEKTECACRDPTVAPPRITLMVPDYVNEKQSTLSQLEINTLLFKETIAKFERPVMLIFVHPNISVLQSAQQK